jgi:hypothetical protein
MCQFLVLDVKTTHLKLSNRRNPTSNWHQRLTQLFYENVFHQGPILASLEDFRLQEEVDINIRESPEMKTIALQMYCELASETVGISQNCGELDNESPWPGHGLHEFKGLSILIRFEPRPTSSWFSVDFASHDLAGW